jgi:pimeloyl-ACP methyl ester carboxylesterase
MAPVAWELMDLSGVMEPLQVSDSLEEQITELHQSLVAYAHFPVQLIGFSWGAWLGFLYAARYPERVHKLILVGSGPFEQRWVRKLEQCRMERLNPGERVEYREIIQKMGRPGEREQQEMVSHMRDLLEKTDAFDIDRKAVQASQKMMCTPTYFPGAWRDAARLRENGELLEIGKMIRCPVVALHGDYDPHPAEGVRQPLGEVLTDFQFFLLEDCGHKPWHERRARERFFEILERLVLD